jgi:hypothetical protein
LHPELDIVSRKKPVTMKASDERGSVKHQVFLAWRGYNPVGAALFDKKFFAGKGFFGVIMILRPCFADSLAGAKRQWEVVVSYIKKNGSNIGNHSFKRAKVLQCCSLKTH